MAPSTPAKKDKTSFLENEKDAETFAAAFLCLDEAPKVNMEKFQKLLNLPSKNAAQLRFGRTRKKYETKGASPQKRKAEIDGDEGSADGEDTESKPKIKTPRKSKARKDAKPETLEDEKAADAEEAE